MTGLDRAALERWGAALGRVAERIERERGVADRWSLSVEDDVLWANYGELRVRLGPDADVLWANYGELRVRLGPDADVQDEAELFDEVDGWVAFDRRPGRVTALERDREAQAAWRAQLPGLQEFWVPVVRRVLDDVASTTALDVTWAVEVDEWVLDLPTTPGLVLTFGAQDLPVRQADFPSVVLKLPHQSFDLPVLDDADDAAAHLANTVQDYVVDELLAAWPVCTGHHHPMLSSLSAQGRAVWRCPAEPDRTVEIGSLGR